MNLAFKQKLAAIIRWIAAFVTIVQTVLTTAPPPANEYSLAIITAALTLLVTSCTAFVNWLSPDISNTAARISTWVTLGIIVTAIADFTNVIHFNEAIAVWVKWGLSSLGLSLTMLGKQLFPSELFKHRQSELKKLK